MWLDTETGKRHNTPPSLEGGEIVVSSIEEETDIETDIVEPPKEKQDDRKRNKRNRQDISHTMEDNPIEETQ